MYQQRNLSTVFNVATFQGSWHMFHHHTGDIQAETYTTAQLCHIYSRFTIRTTQYLNSNQTACCLQTANRLQQAQQRALSLLQELELGKVGQGLFHGRAPDWSTVGRLRVLALFSLFFRPQLTKDDFLVTLRDLWVLSSSLNARQIMEQVFGRFPQKVALLVGWEDK